MRILVTGSKGFIGKNLLQHLKSRRDYEVEGFDIKDGQDVLNINHVRKAVRDVDVVVHLAGKSSSHHFFEDPLKAWRTNVEGTANIVNELSREAKIIFLSTGTIYGDSAKPARESDPLPIPPNLYALSKLEGERLCLLHGNCVILRVFTGYGVGEEHKGAYASPIYKFVKSMLKGEPPLIYGDGKQVRDCIYISDIIKVIEFFIRNNPKHKILNVGTGVGTDFLSVIQIINNLLGTEISPVFTQPPKGYVGSIVADINLLKQEMDFNPISIEEGIKQLIRYFTLPTRPCGRSSPRHLRSCS